MKKCPFCAEEIQDDALVCRYCGRELVKTKPAQIEQPKNSAKNVIFFLIIIILCGCMALYATGNTTGGGSNNLSNHPVQSSGYEITYRIEGTAKSVSLTYQNEQGGTEQQNALVPWKKTYTMQPGDFAYVSAQNNGESGTVICVIELNGKEVKRSTSSGAYTIASCSGGL